MLFLKIFFRFVVSRSAVSLMANSPKELGLLAGAFLVGLGALEVTLYAFGL